jgi:ABC-type ATPase involved in cell division
MAAILEAHDLAKRYRLGATTVDALRGVSLSVDEGEFVALMGPSGSGKSTLLQLLGGLDRPTAGEVILQGETISQLSDDAATKLRRDRTGFVFQSFNLIPLFDVTENVALPFTIAGVETSRGETAERIRDVIALVDLAGKEHHRPDQLSAVRPPSPKASIRRSARPTRSWTVRSIDDAIPASVASEADRTPIPRAMPTTDRSVRPRRAARLRRASEISPPTGQRPSSARRLTSGPVSCSSRRPRVISSRIRPSEITRTLSA